MRAVRSGLIAGLVGISMLSASESLERPRSWKVADFGVLSLNVPSAWAEAGPVVNSPALIHLSFMVPGNKNFQLLVSAIDGREYRKAERPLAVIEQRVKEAGEGWLSTSVESSLRVEKVNGPEFSAYFFRLTDKTTPLPPDEFKHIAQGIGLLGDLAVTFTVFSNDHQSELVERALKTLATARLAKPK